jgi:hypothetical protein
MVSIRTVLYEQYKNEARYMKARVWRERGGGGHRLTMAAKKRD